MTEALEKSRTGQDKRDHVSTDVNVESGVLSRGIGLHTLDLALNLRLDKWEDVLVERGTDLTVRDQYSGIRGLVRSVHHTRELVVIEE